MEYKAYRLAFQGAVHFGRNSLEDGEYTCGADTLFSALCQEALRDGTLDTFYRHVKEGRLLLSDAFPFMGDTYYLPKPMKRVQGAGQKGDSALKKAYKTLRYIPMGQMETYLQGNYDLQHAPDPGMLGRFVMKEATSIRGEEETRPYRVGTYFFAPGNGLYVVAGYEGQEALDLLELLFEMLSCAGIGGKRAAGLGRFMLFSGPLPEDFCRRLEQGRGLEKDGKTYMSLSVSLPREDELEEALQGAEYTLRKRSGFVASERYAPQQQRKRDLYVFQSGSCFQNRYRGDVCDVSGPGGSHPVYRYAKPMFMEVGV